MPYSSPLPPFFIGSIMIKVTFRYVDKSRVLQQALKNAANDRRRLSRAGGYIRTVARRSIRKRKSRAAPGKPPTNRLGHLKNMIMFGVGTASVIVGPMVRSRKTGAPRALEYGGTSSVYISKPRKGRRKGWQRARIQKRPFMRPALAKSQDKVLDMWKNAVS